MTMREKYHHIKSCQIEYDDTTQYHFFNDKISRLNFIKSLKVNEFFINKLIRFW